MNPDLPNSETKATRPHPDPPAPGPQPALTHQTPGGGTESIGIPTCPSHPPGRCLGCSWLSEPEPGTRAGLRLGITPKMHISSFRPIVHPGAASRPSAEGAPSPFTSASWSLSSPLPTLSSWGPLLRGFGGPETGWQDPRMPGASSLLSEMPPAHSQPPGKAGMC